MLKAYSVFESFDEKAHKILNDAKIELVCSKDGKRPTKEELTEIIKKYDILIISVKDKITADMLEKVKTKKIIATLSIGLDHIDESFFTSNLIKIVNCPKSNAISVAEHIFGLILALKKRIVIANDNVINGEINTKKSSDINGNILGLIGSGNISKEVIKIAKVFNMKIYCNTLFPEREYDLLEQGVEFVNLERLLKISDIIAVNVPFTKSTQNLISKNNINLMKNNATFINASRAKVANVEDLIKYADENSEFKVGLDIDVDEYKYILNKKRNNVIITPHIAGLTVESIKRMNVELANNIVSMKNVFEK